MKRTGNPRIPNLIVLSKRFNAVNVVPFRNISSSESLGLFQSPHCFVQRNGNYHESYFKYDSYSVPLYRFL